MKPLTLREEINLLKQELLIYKAEHIMLKNHICVLENKISNIVVNFTHEISTTNNSINRLIDYTIQSDNYLYKVIDFSNYLMERFGTDLIDMEIARNCKIDTSINSTLLYVGGIPRPNSYVNFNI